LLRWIRAGASGRIEAISAALRALHAPSYARYQALLGEHAGGLLEMTGQIYVWRGERPGAAEALAQRLRAKHGVPVRTLDAAAIRALDPELAPDFRYGLFFPENGHTVNPLRLVRTLVALFEQAGGRLLRRTVRGFDIGPEGLRAVRAKGGDLGA